MRIHLRDSETKLSSLVDSVLLNPMSWMDWHCLYIENPDLAEIYQSEERTIAAEAILESYLANLEGVLVMGSAHSMFLISKKMTENDLLKIGYHINDFIIDYKTTEPEITLYDLYYDHDKFVNNVLKKNFAIEYQSFCRTLGSKKKTLIDTDDVTASHILLHDHPLSADYSLNVKKKRVLVVEDDPIARWMVRKTLQSECMVAMASGVNKAFSVYQTYRPDIVFLDIQLPDGSGYDVLEWIMRHDPGATVIMFSASDDAINIARATECGAKGFVPKPFIKYNLLEYIYRV